MPSELEIIKEKLRRAEFNLDVAEGLLEDSRDLMNNTHCYDTEVYHEIGHYFDNK